MAPAGANAASAGLLLLLLLLLLQHLLAACQQLELSGCSRSPCDMQLLCRSEFANVTCRGVQSPAACGAEYRTAGGQPAACSEGRVQVCVGDTLNISCPAGLKVKVWHAQYTPGSQCQRQPQQKQRQGAAAAAYGCTQPALTAAIHLCDARPHCLLLHSRLLPAAADCSLPLLQLELSYVCFADSPQAGSQQQELFFRWGLVIICGMFPASLLTLLVTVQLRKKRQDVYKMSSMHLPLTDHENPPA